MKFKLVSTFKPSGDQPQAIAKLTQGIKAGLKHQVLLGVTGSGKTFTLAQVIEKTQKPALVISHNKTLAAQLYQEFRDFFPNNAVGYFVSYYDYYQPEAYISQTDTYIAKETEINDLIDKLRIEATVQLLSKNDVIIIASVSSIYNLGSPAEFIKHALVLRLNQILDREEVLADLIDLLYDRNEYELARGSFRIKGEYLEIWPSHLDEILKIKLSNKIEEMSLSKPFASAKQKTKLQEYTLYPAKHYLTERNELADIFAEIKKDLQIRVKKLEKMGKTLEAHRLTQRVNYDLEMIAEIGYVNGIENYSRYFDGRKAGEPPYTLLDYFCHAFRENFLVIIDESHMTVPQIKGMYRGDLARKKELIEYGFRLPSCLDNRPLHFLEFLQRTPQIIYSSATPDDWEINQAQLLNYHGVAEQLIRPTGLVDPQISIRSSKGQIQDLIREIKKRQQRKERVLVITLTKRMAEALTSYLHEKEPRIKTTYLHADIETLERSDIIEDLRKGRWQVLVGINLLREGLDLPEVSLVAILDADKEGFLRSKTALIQTMGRAARHLSGEVILYADEVTSSMKAAIKEVERRRQIQLQYNQKHHLTPKSISKPIRKKLIERTEKSKNEPIQKWPKIDPLQLPPSDRLELTKQLEAEMRQAARSLQFEKAIQIRDKIEFIKAIR